MYNFKQKKLHFKALRNPDAAIYDLELLRKGCPWLPQLRTYARDPKRYADEILYSLLDHTTRENIRAFRRQKLDELKTVAEVPGTGSEAPSTNAILPLTMTPLPLMKLPVLAAKLLRSAKLLLIMASLPLMRLPVPIIPKTLQHLKK